MGEPTLNPSSANHRPLNSPAVSASSMYSQDDPKFPFPSTASSTSDVESQPAPHQQQVLNGDQNVVSPPTKKPAFHARLSRMFSHKGDNANVPHGKEKESGAMNGLKSTTPDLIAKPVGLERNVSSTLHAQPNGGVEKHSFMTEKKTVQEPPQSKRFTLHEDGTHEHLLKNDRRQEKLSNMFRNMLGKRKEGQEDHQLSLISSWVDQVKSEKEKEKLAADQKGGPNSADTLVQKYGKCQEVVGRGAFGIVRISHKADSSDPRKELLYAVKEFRRRPSDSPKKYHQRLTSEFCISSALRHPNVIHTLDLMKDAKGDFCEVMEFCAGGDLYTLVLAAGKLEVLEADCYFKQLMRGVEYIHEMGVAHRDLKPENLLLTSHGSLKITDFGNGECFRMAWEKEPHMVAGLCGSAPYIAPEEYVDNEFDPRAVDVWACGVIYMAMRTGRHLWRLARKDEDEIFERYLEGRRDEDGYGPIETLHRVGCVTLTIFPHKGQTALIDNLTGSLQKRYLLHPRPKSRSPHYRLPSSQIRMGSRDQTLQSWRGRHMTQAIADLHVYGGRHFYESRCSCLRAANAFSCAFHFDMLRGPIHFTFVLLAFTLSASLHLHQHLPHCGLCGHMCSLASCMVLFPSIGFACRSFDGE